MRREVSVGESVKRADQGHGHGRRSAGGGAAGRLGVERHTQRHVLGNVHAGDGRLEQRMPVPSRVAGANDKTLAIVLGEDLDALFPGT